MNCKEIDDRLVEVLYGELPEGEESEVRRHLAGCEVCREKFGELEWTKRSLDRVEDESIGVDAGAIYRRELRQNRRSAVRWRAVATAAAIGMVAAVGMMLFQLRVEAGEGRFVVAWGEPDAESHEASAIIKAIENELGRQKVHVATLGELVGLVVAEVDGVEARRVASLNRINGVLKHLTELQETRFSQVEDGIEVLYREQYSSENSEGELQ